MHQLGNIELHDLEEIREKISSIETEIRKRIVGLAAVLDFTIRPRLSRHSIRQAECHCDMPMLLTRTGSGICRATLLS